MLWCSWLTPKQVEELGGMGKIEKIGTNLYIQLIKDNNILRVRDKNGDLKKTEIEGRKIERIKIEDENKKGTEYFDLLKVDRKEGKYDIYERNRKSHEVKKLKWELDEIRIENLKLVCTTDKWNTEKEPTVEEFILLEYSNKTKEIHLGKFSIFIWPNKTVIKISGENWKTKVIDWKVKFLWEGKINGEDAILLECKNTSRDAYYKKRYYLCINKDWIEYKANERDGIYYKWDRRNLYEFVPK